MPFECFFKIKWAMSDEFKLGFRISIFDICILVAGSVFAAFLFHKSQILFGLIVALVVGHFFLFCNVFRILPSIRVDLGYSIRAIVDWNIFRQFAFSFPLRCLPGVCACVDNSSR